MPLIHRAVAKCLTINQGTQTEMGGGGEVCGGAEKLAVPREGESVQSVEAPIQPTGAQGFCSGNHLFREYTFPFLPASQKEGLVRS